MGRPLTAQGFQPQQPPPHSLPRPITAAQFPVAPGRPPEEADLEEVDELSYEDVEAEEVLDEAAQAAIYEEAEAYDAQDARGYHDPNAAAYTDEPAYAEPAAYGAGTTAAATRSCTTSVVTSRTRSHTDAVRARWPAHLPLFWRISLADLDYELSMDDQSANSTKPKKK